MVKFKNAKGTPFVVSGHGKVRHIPAKYLRDTTTHTREFAVIDFTMPRSENLRATSSTAIVKRIGQTRSIRNQMFRLEKLIPYFYH